MEGESGAVPSSRGAVAGFPFFFPITMAFSVEPRFSLHPQARACASLVLALACLGAVPHLHAQASGASPVAEALRSYSIPAGSLEEALNRFGRESGLLLSFTQEQVQGLRSPGLQGSHVPRSGLAALLRGSGLEAVAAPGGGYTLRKAAVAQPIAGTATLAEVKVVANQLGDMTEGSGAYTTDSVRTATKLICPSARHRSRSAS